MFTGEADYRIKPDGERVLLTPIQWAEKYGSRNSRTLTAPEGMIHDGASIPPIFAALNGPSVQLAASLHDAAYRFQHWDDGDVPGQGPEMTRMEADLIILRAAKVAQGRARKSFGPTKQVGLQFTHWVQRWIIFLTVVLLGAPAWKKGPGKVGLFDHDTLAEILSTLTLRREQKERVDAELEAADT